jgi:hypothetical protein
MYLKPAPCRALEPVPIGRSLRGAERLPMREFKEDYSRGAIEM